MITLAVLLAYVQASTLGHASRHVPAMQIIDELTEARLPVGTVHGSLEVLGLVQGRLRPSPINTATWSYTEKRQKSTLVAGIAGYGDTLEGFGAGSQLHGKSTKTTYYLPGCNIEIMTATASLEGRPYSRTTASVYRARAIDSKLSGFFLLQQPLREMAKNARWRVSDSDSNRAKLLADASFHSGGNLLLSSALNPPFSPLELSTTSPNGKLRLRSYASSIKRTAVGFMPGKIEETVYDESGKREMHATYRIAKVVKRTSLPAHVFTPRIIGQTTVTDHRMVRQDSSEFDHSQIRQYELGVGDRFPTLTELRTMPPRGA